MVSCILSCKTAPPKNKTTVAPDTVVKSAVPKKAHSPTEQRAQMEFVNYNDDGDYFLLFARKADSTYSFIYNDEDRSLNRGDLIEVKWKKGIIEIAGDGDAPADADITTTVTKVSDGAVSKFRNSYGKQIKYIRPESESYSTSYLDKIYKVVEYYLANTKVPLLQQIIDKKEALSYSVEQQTKNSREYTMIGISTTNEHNVNTVQWLYFDGEHEILYEYDLPKDELVLFR
ncbi:hypothetical protein GCM10011425_34390 [Mucilaginibacter galii]|uniref:Uncharacterized protein n=2 Tax=Mucilaginibacter galii TaxID=2005073 RepID=A0A917JCS9_9SPHI|nr:hypothetical protein GCM10011425_34390 [Mucilaginibacter galii]